MRFAQPEMLWWLLLVPVLGGALLLASSRRRRALDRFAGGAGNRLRFSAEVSPHHLAFDDTAVATTDSNFKVMPPIRSASDRDGLIRGLVDGTIDAVATDHAPHAALEKEVPFEYAPNGILGLEWAAAVAIGSAELDQQTFFERMSIAPASIAGFAWHGQAVEQGGVANLVVVDPNANWTPMSTLSKSRNSPYFGMDMTGRVAATMLRGSLTYELAHDDVDDES